MMTGRFPHPAYSRHVLEPAYQDAQHYLFEPMLEAHEAHALTLAECGIIPAENAVAILRAVATIRAEGVDAYAYQPGVEDLFFRIEARVMALAGVDYGGNLQLARSRNDLGHALARMAIRLRLLELGERLLTLRAAVQTRAKEHLNTLMPGYTHTQPAQPTTFAHYLAGVLTFLSKGHQALLEAYRETNCSPLGAAALTGTGFPFDRRRVAELLGFDKIVVSTQHAIGGSDYLTDTAFVVQTLAVNLGRMTHDLLIRALQEVNALHVDDSFVQISSIMPQKRNPVVLEHLRARLSRALGYAQTVVVQCHNIPYGDTQDIEDEILPPLFHALDALQEAVELYTAFFETLTLNVEHLQRRAGEGFTTATELADTLVREAGLSFRSAHQVVATLVQDAVKAGLGTSQLTLAMLQQAAQKVLGHPLPLNETQFRQALNPLHFIHLRNGPGGVAPAATKAVLDELEQFRMHDLETMAALRQQLMDAQMQRQQAAATLAASIAVALEG